MRLRVERALATEEVNLASEQGRARAQTLIEEVLRAYEADALNGQERELAADEREQLARELRDDLIGLGAIAERMLADPFAQEWMINGPKRVFRDTGERIERVPELALMAFPRRTTFPSISHWRPPLTRTRSRGCGVEDTKPFACAHSPYSRISHSWRRLLVMVRPTTVAL